MFTRSKNGIQNRRLFTRTNYTVFVETTPEELIKNGLDLALWKEFFAYYYPNLRIRFVPLGGKHNVEIMAKKIIREAIGDALCAMDRDYDDRFGKLNIDNRVFYTFGYGAENDLLSPTTIETIVSGLLPSLNSTNEHAIAINSFIDETVITHKICFLADQIGKSRDKCPMNRDNPTADIDHNRKTLPVRLRKEVILTQFKDGPKTTRHPYLKPLYSSRYDVPAHHYFEIVFHTISRYVATKTSEKVKKSTFASLICSAIRNNFFSQLSGDIRKHFDILGSRALG